MGHFLGGLFWEGVFWGRGGTRWDAGGGGKYWGGGALWGGSFKGGHRGGALILEGGAAQKCRECHRCP